MNIYGLIGRNISYSFSEHYFSEKFKKMGLVDCLYKTFDIADIDYLPQVIKKNKPLGLNVTIPYKEAIIPFLDELSETAEEIRAVNTLKVLPDGKLSGYNTDVYGFETSLKPLLKSHHKQALVFGTGGASKAVCWVLNRLGIKATTVSRKSSENTLCYTELTPDIISEHTLLINCTPLGTFPNIHQNPELPFEGITSLHLAYDLIYNPEQTRFLTLAQQQGAQIKNGYDMLVFQAEESWRVWNN